jgi:hypothetical protein
MAGGLVSCHVRDTDQIYVQGIELKELVTCSGNYHPDLISQIIPHRCEPEKRYRELIPHEIGRQGNSRVFSSSSDARITKKPSSVGRWQLPPAAAM